MKIATLNIDWAQTYKTNNRINAIQDAISLLDADIIVLTEAIMLDLPNYRHFYKTTTISTSEEYEDLNYSKYLKGHSAHRVIIYSKYQSSQNHSVRDEATSICQTFDTTIGRITLYCTIIGTWFTKKPVYAQKELDNCLFDCLNIAKEVDHFFLLGDFNTTFGESKNQIQVLKSARQELERLCKTCDLSLKTDVAGNINHIFVSNSVFQTHSLIDRKIIPKDGLSDHSGILINIGEKYIS